MKSILSYNGKFQFDGERNCMRKITINRKKALVGCAEKVLIYTIDRIEEDMAITKNTCNFLGSVKNNSAFESEITENEITIIAAYDNLGVFMVTDHRVIPQGTDDVVINGKVKFNPTKGNPFIFEK